MGGQPPDEAGREALIQRIREAFAEVPPPAADNITPHECDECDRLREALINRHPDDLSDQWVRQNYDQLPLLSDEAKHYYLPAYLRATLREAEAGSSVGEFVLYALASNHRWEPEGGYSARQRAVVFAYLTSGLPEEPEEPGDTDLPFAESYVRALARWGRTLDD